MNFNKAAKYVIVALTTTNIFLHSTPVNAGWFPVSGNFVSVAPILSGKYEGWCLGDAIVNTKLKKVLFIPAGLSCFKHNSTLGYAGLGANEKITVEIAKTKVELNVVILRTISISF